MLDNGNTIFIGGSGRSGTTLMAQLLDTHADVASLFEVPMLVTMLQWLKNTNLSKKSFVEKIFWEADYCNDPANQYNWRLLPEELYISLAEFFERLNSGCSTPDAIREWLGGIHTIQKIRDGASRIVHKTPALALYTNTIFELWPDAYFIHMLRNPVDVIASYLNQDFGPETISEGIDWYCQRVGEAIRHGRQNRNYVEIRLEDLVEKPEATLSSLQEFVGLEMQSKKMLEKMNINKGQIQLRKDFFETKTKDQIFSKVCELIPEVSDFYK